MREHVRRRLISRHRPRAFLVLRSSSTSNASLRRGAGTFLSPTVLAECGDDLGGEVTAHEACELEDSGCESFLASGP